MLLCCAADACSNLIPSFSTSTTTSSYTDTTGSSSSSSSSSSSAAPPQAHRSPLRYMGPRRKWDRSQREGQEHRGLEASAADPADPAPEANLALAPPARRRRCRQGRAREVHGAQESASSRCSTHQPNPHPPTKIPLLVVDLLPSGAPRIRAEKMGTWELDGKMEKIVIFRVGCRVR